MREVKQFTEEAFLEAFIFQLKTRCISFADIAPTEREFTESIKPFIESADMMFIAHFIGEETYSKCRNLYTGVCARSEELLHNVKAVNSYFEVMENDNGGNAGETGSLIG